MTTGEQNGPWRDVKIERIEQLTPRIMLGVLMILTAVTLIIAAKPLLELAKKHTRH